VNRFTLAATSAVVIVTTGMSAVSARAQTAGSSAGAAAGPSRYQIGVMERVLETAVEQGANETRERLQAVLPTSVWSPVNENARARGFRLDGYGVFFDVLVPSIEGTLAWSFRTMDREDLGLQSALRALKSHVDASGDPNLDQALRRVELQIGPLRSSESAGTAAPSGAAAGVSRVVGTRVQAADSAPSDPILADPDEAYRTEVKQALKEAMLDYAGPLGIRPQEWLTIAARRDEDLSRVSLRGSAPQTIVLRISGADLAAVRAGTLSREDAIKRMETQVF
jgi:hypothetical protein